MEIRRRRVRSNGFDSLTAEQQVQYVIDNWNEIWTPVDAEIDFSISMDDMEHFDYYYIPDIEDEIEGTEFEKYKFEIIQDLWILYINK